VGTTELAALSQLFQLFEVERSLNQTANADVVGFAFFKHASLRVFVSATLPISKLPVILPE
jgi:hypothetical protein